MVTNTVSPAAGLFSFPFHKIIEQKKAFFVCVCVHASSSASLSGHCNLMMTETNIWLLLTVWTNQMVKNLLFKVFDVLVQFHLNASCTQSTTF